MELSNYNKRYKIKTNKMKKPELLTPAGNFEKLKVAIHYGADAVYLAGPEYGLRKNAGNFSLPELGRAIQYAHEKKVKVYVAVNIFPRNNDLDGITGYFKEIENMSADALIVSDPGIFQIAKKNVPDINVHLSTQANTTNWASAQFWKDQGIKRICVARELSLREVVDIRKKTDMEIELFVHGAMCISYSGRCLMSKYMANRDANKGDCSQTCRWDYVLMEKKREGEYFPIEEDERGAYFFSSKDLCLIKYIPDLIQSGATSFKIEGRMKSVYYVGMTTKIYREAIDAYWKDKENYKYNPEWEEELLKTSNRAFTTGFFNGELKDDVADSFSNIQTYDFLGIVKKSLSKNSASIDVRNKIVSGDEVELVRKKNKPSCLKVEAIFDSEGIRKKETAQPNDEVILQLNTQVEKYDILRKKRNGCNPNTGQGK